MMATGDIQVAIMTGRDRLTQAPGPAVIRGPGSEQKISAAAMEVSRPSGSHTRHCHHCTRDQALMAAYAVHQPVFFTALPAKMPQPAHSSLSLPCHNWQLEHC